MRVRFMPHPYFSAETERPFSGQDPVLGKEHFVPGSPGWEAAVNKEIGEAT
jgi:hypothetical protein